MSCLTRGLASWFTMIVLLTGIAPAAAQAKRPFEDLGRYLHPGDTVFVVERAEGSSAGRVVRVTPSEIVISAGGRERRLTEDSVGWLETTPDSIGDGAAAGAVLGLAYALPAFAFGESGSGLLVLGAGAGVGLVCDALVVGRRLVYGRYPPIPFMRRPTRVTSLSEVWSRVRPGAPIRVEDSTGTVHRGKFVKASGEGITITTRGQAMMIEAPNVRRVQIRYVSGHSIWIGLGLGAVGGALADHGEYERHGTREDIGRGVLLGGVAGFLLAGVPPRYSDIYRTGAATSAAIAVAPIMDGRRRGIALRVAF